MVETRSRVKQNQEEEISLLKNQLQEMQNLYEDEQKESLYWRGVLRYYMEFDNINWDLGEDFFIEYGKLGVPENKRVADITKIVLLSRQEYMNLFVSNK